MLLQSPRVPRAVTLAPALLREPFARYGLECLELRDSSLVLFLLPLSARIDVVGEESPRFVSLLAGALQRDFGIDAEGEVLFRFAGLAVGAAAIAVLETPPFMARSSDEQVQPFLVVELPILLARLGLFDLDIGSAALGGNSPCWRLDAASHPLSSGCPQQI